MNTPKLRFPEFSDKWQERRLEGLFSEFKSGQGITSTDITEEGNFRVFGGNGLRGYSDKYTHQGEYFLIGRQGALCGNINRANGKVFISEHAIACKANDTSNTEWLAQRLDYLNLNRLSESSAQPGLAVNKLLRLKLITPCQSEQTKIANFLTAVDDKLTQLKKKKSLLEQYKKGVMQKLFSQDLRFKDDNGEDFVEWEEKRLGEICSLITKGTTPTSVGYNFTDDGVNFIKIESLTESGVIIPNKVAYISRQCHQALKRSQLEKDDILFSIAGALGRIGIVMSDILPANTNQALAIIRISPESGVLVKFIAKFFVSDSISKEIEGLKGGAAQMNLSLGQLNNLIIPIPELPEQTKIANFLSTIDEKINHCGVQIEKMEGWKKGLLQKMFV